MNATAERHYCRNPRCKSKLPVPVSNVREAFCARGCYTQFYRKRCLVCERPMERTTEARQLCGRPKCNSRLRSLKAHFSLGCYYPGAPALNDARNPIKTGVFSPLKNDRGWRQVAGPPVNLRLATVGAEDAVKNADKVNRRHWADAGAAALIQRHHAPVNVVGGFKFPDAPQIEITPIGKVSASTSIPVPVITEGDDPLAIPACLQRPLPEVPA